MGSVRRLLGSLAAVSPLLVGAGSSSQVSDHEARELGTRIDVKRVVRVRIAEQVSAYHVELRYAFARYRTVDLSPLGIVPAEGSFRFITRERELVLRERPGGAILMRVVPEETERVVEPTLLPNP